MTDTTKKISLSVVAIATALTLSGCGLLPQSSNTQNENKTATIGTSNNSGGNDEARRTSSETTTNLNTSSSQSDSQDAGPVPDESADSSYSTQTDPLPDQSEQNEQPQQHMSGVIGMEAAKNIALTHANALNGVGDLVIIQDRSEPPSYLVEFKANNLQYHYKIDAATGNILEGYAFPLS